MGRRIEVKYDVRLGEKGKHVADLLITFGKNTSVCECERVDWQWMEREKKYLEDYEGDYSFEYLLVVTDRMTILVCLCADVEDMRVTNLDYNISDLLCVGAVITLMMCI